MRTRAEVFQRQREPEEYERAMVEIVEQVQRMSRLVEQLLDMSRLGSVKPMAHLSCVTRAWWSGGFQKIFGRYCRMRDSNSCWSFLKARDFRSFATSCC